MQAIEYRIHIGRNVGNRPMDELKFAQIIRKLEQRLANIELEDGTKISGTTTYTTRGQWLGQFEDSVIVSTIVIGPYNSRVHSSIREIVREIKREAQQESILLVKSPVDVEFV